MGVPLPLLLSEQPVADYSARLRQRAEAQRESERPLLKLLCRPVEELSHETLRAVKRALLLLDWIEGVAGPVIESTYSVWVGAAGRLAADCARRTLLLAELCAASGWEESRIQPLHELAGRLRSRPVDAVALHRNAPLSSPTAPISGAEADGTNDSMGRSLSMLIGALHAQNSSAASLAPRRAARQRRI